MSQKLASFADFGVAAKEYVHIMRTIKRLAYVTAELRTEQRRLSGELHYMLIEQDRRHHTCRDLTRLEIRTTTRKIPLRREYIVREMAEVFDAPRAEALWKNIEARRKVTETETLAFRATDADSSDDEEVTRLG